MVRAQNYEPFFPYDPNRKTENVLAVQEMACLGVSPPMHYLDEILLLWSNSKREA